MNGVGCASSESERDPEDHVPKSRGKAKPEEAGSRSLTVVPENCVKLFGFHWNNKRKLT